MNIEEQHKDAAATVIGIAPRTHRTVPCVPKPYYYDSDLIYYRITA